MADDDSTTNNSNGQMKSSSSASLSGGKAGQIAKLREANNKYKNLLKMAKERIQKVETQNEKLEQQMKDMQEQLDMEKAKNISMEQELQQQQQQQYRHQDSTVSSRFDDNGDGDSESVLVRVCQRIRVETDDDDEPSSNGGSKMMNDDEGLDDGSLPRSEIWALLEMEVVPPEDGAQLMSTSSNGNSNKRWKVWKRFPSEAALSDYILRDSGEPITLPPYSLSPDQSARIETEARQVVSHISEEFRRYRVRAEVLRKQSERTVEVLKGASVHQTQRKIEGADLAKDLAHTKAEHAQLVQLRRQLKEQEAQWKDAYDTLLQENTALKGSGAEALLASQWRHRYEQSERDKDILETKLEGAEKQLRDGVGNVANGKDAKYEAKYRDMKESFRLYRKKAKEIFEAQQRGDGAAATGMMLHMDGAGASGGDGGGGRHGGEEAKVAYLRNLMVNYLCSDEAVKEHMETAIHTVLKFSPEDVQKIKDAKRSQESWF